MPKIKKQFPSYGFNRVKIFHLAFRKALGTTLFLIYMYNSPHYVQLQCNIFPGTIDNHISNICRSAANQLNALIRVQSHLNFKAKRVLINSYIISNFNYCPQVRIFSTAKSLNKIESLQKRAFRFLYNDYSVSYEGLLEKSGKVKMSVNTLRNLCVEIYKTINKLNPEFMNNIFKVKENTRLVREQYKLNLETPEWNQVTFGTKILKVYGPKVWNSLPFHIKTSENLIQFKSLIKNWNGNSCSCTVYTK